MGSWCWNILRVFIIQIPWNWLQSRFMALMVFRKMEVEVKVRKLKNGKAAGKDEVMGEMIKMDVTW